MKCLSDRKFFLSTFSILISVSAFAMDGKVDASASSPGFTVDSAIRGKVNATRFWEVVTGFPIWMKNILPKARVLSSYWLSAGPDEPNRMPTAWVLEGSNGAEWTELDRENVTRWEPMEVRSFDLQNQQAFLSYRLAFLKGNSDIFRIYKIAFQYAGEGTPSEVQASFELKADGTLEWKGDLSILKTSGAEHPADLPDGRKRARPGGTIAFVPHGDYMRSALDLIPTTGKLPQVDARAEVTVHRIIPSEKGVEMASYMALATEKFPFGIALESTGIGKPRPFIFFTERENSTFDKAEFFSEAMRMTAKGAIQFSRRHGSGPMSQVLDDDPLVVDQTPWDAAIIERQDPGRPGRYDSDYILLVAKTRTGDVVNRHEWRINAHAGKDGTNLVVRFGYKSALSITNSGDVILGAKGAVIMASPNGHRWRLSVTDNGEIKATRAE